MYEIKIPNEFNLGGHTYNVRIDLETDAELQDGQRRGEHSDLLRRIRISSSLPPEEISCTFIHECCHAIDCVYCNAELSEFHVRNMAEGVHQILAQLGVRFIK